MEREKYIDTLLNSTNGITKVVPSDDLFSRIEMRIQSEATVPAKTIWLVAASIAALLIINISVIVKNKIKNEDKIEASFSSTLHKSNQLY